MFEEIGVDEARGIELIMQTNAQVRSKTEHLQPGPV